MLNFEALEMIKNSFVEESFQDFLEENPKYGTFLQSLITKGHTFLCDLQDRLAKRSEFSQSKDETSLVKEDPLIKEFCTTFLYLGKYFTSALETMQLENAASTFQQFDIQKMFYKCTKSVTNISESLQDSSGLVQMVYSANNFGYLTSKLPLLVNTSYFAITGGDAKKFTDALVSVKEDISTTMYSLSIQLWKSAASPAALQSGTDFSKALKKCFGKLKSLGKSKGL